MPEPTSLPTVSPSPNADDQTFWDGLLEDRVSLPRCVACEHIIWYPRPVCPACSGTDVEWFEATGAGSIYSFSVTRKIPGRWSGSVPFVLAYVELDEGPRVLTNIVDTDVESVHIGQRVRAVFHDATDGGALLRFTPVT
jgi:uncharacterized OB-fold protein